MAKALPATFKIPRQPEFPDVTFLRVNKGKLPEQFEVTITPYDTMRWARLHDDAHPWYRGDSPWGGPAAMPWIMYFSSMNLLGHEFGRERHLPSEVGGGGFARYRAEFLAPIPVGSVVTVGGEVTDKYSRRGRGYIQWRLDASIDGRLVQQHWKDWAFPASLEDLENWPERVSDPHPPEVPALATLEPIRMKMTIDRTIEFEGPIPLNNHNDLAAARAAGRPAPLVQGELTFGLLCRVLRDHFGAGFVVGGTIDVRFIQPVYVNQTITAHAEVLSSQADRAFCRVWAENEDGGRVVTGTASAKLSP